MAAWLLLAEATLAEKSRSCTANLTTRHGSDPPHTPEDPNPEPRADGMEIFSKLLPHLSDVLLNIDPIWIGCNSIYTYMSVNRDE